MPLWVVEDVRTTRPRPGYPQDPSPTAKVDMRGTLATMAEYLTLP